LPLRRRSASAAQWDDVVGGRVDDALDLARQPLEGVLLLGDIVIAVVGAAHQGHDVTKATFRDLLAVRLSA
jgi:hypothetical protein